MLKKAPIVLLVLALASPALADSPQERSFSGPVTLARAGQLFHFQWDNLDFGPTYRFGPNLDVGWFTVNTSGFKQSGYYFYDSATGKTSGRFYNEWNSWFQGVHYPASIYGNGWFVIQRFSDRDGNVLAWHAGLQED